MAKLKSAAEQAARAVEVAGTVSRIVANTEKVIIGKRTGAPPSSRSSGSPLHFFSS